MQLFLQVSIKKSKIKISIYDYIIEAKEKYNLDLELLNEKHGLFKDSYKIYFFCEDKSKNKNLLLFLKYLEKEGFEVLEY